MAIYGIASYAVLKRKMRNAIHVEKNIYEAEIDTPFVLGILTPKIYIPLTLSARERGYIILHEQTHIRRCDHIVKIVAYFTLCLHWFNPFTWVANKLLDADMEMSCDERVIKNMGDEIKKDYSLSLLSLGAEQQLIGSYPLAFGKGNINERVKNVLNFKKRSKLTVVLTAVLVVGIGIGFAGNRISEANSMPSAFEYNSFEDFTEPLARLGLVNIPFTSENPLLHANGEPHLYRLSEDQPVLISSEEDVDVLLALAKFVIEQELDGILWETCVDDALNEAGLYDYWRDGFRELTRPGREQQIIDMATNYPFEELLEMFYNSPGLLEEFQKLGFFQDVVLDGSNTDNKEN